MDKNKNLTEGKILPQILTFSLPIIATLLLQQLFNTADTLVVGRWGGDTVEEREIALSAVAACGALINLLVGLFAGMASGAGILASHAVGAKNYDRLKNIIHTSIIAASISGIFIGAVGIIFARPLLTLMSTPTDVIDQSVLYMTAVFCGVPAQIIFNYCAAILRSSGNNTQPLVFLSISGALNVALNIVMVVGFHTGALGVGVATAVANYAACIAIIIYMARTEGICKFSFRKLRIDFATLKQIFSYGIPIGIQSSMFSIGNVVVQSAFNSLNSTVFMSGSSICDNVAVYIVLVANGIIQSTQIFVGQNMGAKRIDRINSGVKHGLLLITLTTVVFGVIANLLAEPIFSLFAPNNTQVIEFAKTKLLIISPC
ncbi:MAG: MATE family efflux transporter, partial [Clostridia bacterium]|nr:MATE family efflux transporter [Clostridia bacterium]